jgi:pimeloyl-ACP methyl ester carboxylesterase
MEGVAMAKVVLVHGAFNELWGPHEIASRWVPALRDGLAHHGADVAADDVAVCFYGDLFRLDPETVDEDQWQRTRAGASDMLEGLVGDGGLEAISQAASSAAFERTVDLVSVLVGDPSVAEVARSRLLALLGPETRVLVAHSLGTVLSYNALVAHPEVAVPTLVTLGSPLGSAVADGLLPEPEASGHRPWPGVDRWVNVAAVGDRATGEGRLAPRFGDRVEDRRVDNGHRAHDPEPYLNNPVTGEAVASALSD